MTGTVLAGDNNRVRTLTLNRPERLNAMNAELLADFHASLHEALADDEVKVVVVRGAGRAFCSGDDLKDFSEQDRSEEEARAFIESIQDISRQLLLGDKFVVGAIHGWAVGGGLEWAINCDLAIFAEGTRCFFPEIKWGMFPTGAVTALLPRLVGLMRTREMILFGEEIDAGQALEMKLAWKVVPEARLFDFAQETAERIAALPRGAVADLKKVLNRAGSFDLEDALTLETEATMRGFLDPDTAERVRNFKQ